MFTHLSERVGDCGEVGMGGGGRAGVLPLLHPWVREVQGYYTSSQKLKELVVTIASFP